MSNLQKRIITSVILFPLSIFFIIKGGSYIVSFLYAVLILGNYELFSAFRRKLSILFLDGLLLVTLQSILHLRYGAANMDEEVFECPHQIDLDRKALTRHLTFSQGHRTCPGNGISRLEQVITWNLIFDRVKNISFTPETKFEHQPGIMLGALELILNFSKED